MPATPPRPPRAPGGAHRARAGTAPTGDRLVVALVGLRVLAAAVVVLSHQESIHGGFNGDVFRYIEISTARGVPYRDFQVEYPPVTWLLIRLLTGADAARSMVLLTLSQLACDLGIAAVLRAGWSRRAGVAYLVLGAPLVLYPLPYLRVDLLSVLLGVGALALARRGRPATGGAVLAAAVLAKLWPAVLVPRWLVAGPSGRGRATPSGRALAAGAVAGGAGVAVWWAVAGTDGLHQVLSFRDATGWQVESVAGSLWHLHDPTRLKLESGAFRTGVMPVFARPLLTVLGLAFVAAAWLLAAARHRRGDDAVLDAHAPLAAVTALLVFAPILSPQYVLWLLPFAALAVADGDRWVGRITFATTTATMLVAVFVGAAATGWLAATTLVVGRNALLVALLVVAFQRLAGVRGAPAADAMPEPARPPVRASRGA